MSIKMATVNGRPVESDVAVALHEMATDLDILRAENKILRTRMTTLEAMQLAPDFYTSKELIARLRNETIMEDEIRGHAKEAADILEAISSAEQLMVAKTGYLDVDLLVDNFLKIKSESTQEIERLETDNSFLLGTLESSERNVEMLVSENVRLAAELSANRKQEPAVIAAHRRKKKL